MAKVTLIIEDGEWGELNLHVTYDPPLRDGDKMTMAQLLGGTLQTQVIPDLIGDEGEVKNVDGQDPEDLSDKRPSP